MFVGIKRLKAIFNLPQQGIPYIYKALIPQHYYKIFFLST